jgi:hypothetical protein
MQKGHLAVIFISELYINLTLKVGYLGINCSFCESADPEVWLCERLLEPSGDNLLNIFLVWYFDGTSKRTRSLSYICGWRRES